MTLGEGEHFLANGKCVIARTEGVPYRIRRPTRSLLKTYLSGEGYCRAYDGPGRLLVSSIPYWRYRLFGNQPDLARAAPAAM
jgi:uncharacterized protein (AIM24 family)